MTAPAPGQPQERTAISWGRTALSVLALALLLLKLGLDRDSPLELAAAAVAALTAAGLGRHGRLAYRRSPGQPAVPAVRATTAALVVVGVLAISGAILG